MTQQPKISVITVSYNSSSTIEKTIKSVIEQDYINKEYIIIDGNSDDGTQKIISEYIKDIDVFISEDDNGISDAFNKGIRQATGDLIVCINSDDYLLPNILTTVASQYDGSHDIYCGNLILWDEATDYKSIIKPSLHFPPMPFFRKPAHQGMFITKELYICLGLYDEKIKYAMDLDLLMRATKHRAKFKHMDFNVAVFKLGGATEDSIFKKRREYVYIIHKNSGSLFKAYIFYVFLMFTQTTKKILSKTGFDLVRRIRYQSFSK